MNTLKSANHAGPSLKVVGDEKTVVEVCNKKEKEYRLHIPWRQYEKERLLHFNRFGYQYIVLWDDMNDEEIVEQAGCRHTILGMPKYAKSIGS